MFSKASLKKINDMIQWIISIALIGIGIYYFFISKDIFRGRMFPIIWVCVGITNAGCIIDSKYFENNFTWKNNWVNILQVSISIFIVLVETLWV